MRSKELIIYHDRDAQRHFTMFDCVISCDECPFRFRCLTINRILVVSEGEYREATEVIAGMKYLQVVGMGSAITWLQKTLLA